MKGRHDEQDRLREVRKIWDQAPHKAFTDLVRFKDEWFTTFREAPGHGVPSVGHEGRTSIYLAKVKFPIED